MFLWLVVHDPNQILTLPVQLLSETLTPARQSQDSDAHLAPPGEAELFPFPHNIQLLFCLGDLSGKGFKEILKMMIFRNKNKRNLS